MQDSQGVQPKQLLSERIKNATNILVTVSRDPGIDELSAALALTLLLNKIDKHATAVFSGKIVPAMEFLKPEKTFEGTVDSLRDFIIALDKNKADRLRYKVEDDVVRIFITPYRTVIGEKDLAFSQGDFNVELIIALGVEKREDLDAAVTAHGRILHDATVATINVTDQNSSLGAIDWTDASASSFSEMLMSLSESLKPGVLDEQIATALLTGIVSATERFANDKTTPKVMTMAAQLMAAGANQQLIVTKLQEGNELPTPRNTAADGSTHLEEGTIEKLDNQNDKKTVTTTAESKNDDGEMQIEHTPPSKDEIATEKAVELADEAEEHNEELADKAEKHDEELSTDQANQKKAKKTQPSSTPESKVPELPKLPLTTPTLSVDDLKKDLESANAELEKDAAKPLKKKFDFKKLKPDWKKALEEVDEPTFGGTLNATTDEAHDAKQREERLSRNHTLLSHDQPSIPQAPLNSKSKGYVDDDEPSSVDIFAAQPSSNSKAALDYETTDGPDTHGTTLQPLSAEMKTSQQKAVKAEPSLAELEAQAQKASTEHVEEARAAVNATLDSLPFNPANEPLVASGSQPFSIDSLHEPSNDEATANTSVGNTGTDISLSLPPLPDFSTLPPLPQEDTDKASPAPSDQTSATPSDPMFSPAQPTSKSPADSSKDPGQFKLPGQ